MILHTASPVEASPVEAAVEDRLDRRSLDRRSLDWLEVPQEQTDSPHVVRSEQQAGTNQTSCCTGQMLDIHEVCFDHQRTAVRRCLNPVVVGQLVELWGCDSASPELKNRKLLPIVLNLHLTLLFCEFDRL